MHKRFFIIVLFFALLLNPKLKAQQTSISETKAMFDQFEWLIGLWERLEMKGDRRGFEEWGKVSDSLYVGSGITLEKADTVFVEKLQIVRKDSAIYYVADVPENPSPVWFEMTKITDNSFIAENPDHDFPKRIVYQKREGELKVLTSGDAKSIEFRFLKKK